MNWQVRGSYHKLEAFTFSQGELYKRRFCLFSFRSQMNENSSISSQPRPHPFDLALVVVGPTLFGAGLGMFNGILWYAILGFVVGCALGAMAWWWPGAAGIVILVLSIPAMFYGLVFTLYTLGMPQALVSLFGSAAFLAGGIGILRCRTAARRQWRHIFIVSLAAVFLLYFVILWPPQGRAILLSLPILEQGDPPPVQADAGGIWAASWSAPQMTIAEALENVTQLLESDGWTIVDTTFFGPGTVLISAQRGAYSLEVIYEPEPPGSYWPDAYMAAYVRRGQARQFDEVGTEIYTVPAVAVRERDGPTNSHSSSSR